MNDIFVLKIATDNCKKGKQFSCFGGLVYGTILTINGKEEKLNFNNAEYFRLKRKYNKSIKN